MLHPGASTVGRTITVYNPTRQRVDFDPTVSALPGPLGAPAFGSQPVIQASVGSPYLYPALAHDPNGESLTYFLYRAPVGMTVDPATGVVRWTPGAGSPVAADVVLQVYDARGARDSQQFTITVAGANRAPVLAPLPSTIAATEGQTVRIDVSATDLDGDALRFWADNLPGGAVFDSGLHTLLWTPGPHAAGTYPGVTFTVDDGLHRVRQVVTLQVAPSDAAPALDQPPDRIVNEGDTLVLALHATDPHGKPVRYTSAQLPPGSTLDPITGLFRWTPTYFGHGDYTVPITASNGSQSATRSFRVSVLNANAAPVFDPIERFQVAENGSITFQVFALDPDNASYVPPVRNADGSLTPLEGPVATVAYTVSGLPAGATFDLVTGQFAWTPGFTSAGTYRVTFRATDTGDGTGVSRSTDAVATLVVTDVNRAPALLGITNKTVARGQAIDVPVQATDPDGEPLTITAEGLPGYAIPSFVTFTDRGDGTATLHIAPGASARGAFPITLHVRDRGNGDRTAVLSAETTFVITVDAPNDAPRFAPIADQLLVIGETARIVLRATDLDADALTFAADNLPTGASLAKGLEYGTTIFSWTPAAGDAGTRVVTFRVTDNGQGTAANRLSDSLAVRLIARAGDTSPALPAVADATVAVGQPLTIALNATDADHDPLTYSAAGLPVGATLDPIAGIITWTPADGQQGTYGPILITASDGARSATRAITIVVTPINHAPTLAPPALILGREGAPIALVLAGERPGSRPIDLPRRLRPPRRRHLQRGHRRLRVDAGL